MKKLQMCRICLVKNVRMYVVVNKNLHELYKKLTDNLFVTEDRRPILACFFCCTKLKQCFRLMRKCLEAEELFAQMMNEDYEPNQINSECLVFYGGFVRSPAVITSTVDECQTGSIAIKEKLPALCEGLDDIEPININQSDDLELVNVDNSRLNVEQVLPHSSGTGAEDDEPFMQVTIKVEEVPEVSEMTTSAVESNNLEPENVDDSYLDEEDIALHYSESDSEGEPLMGFTAAEVEEAVKGSKDKQTAVETNSAPVTRIAKLEDTIIEEQNNEQSHLKVFRTTRNRTSKPDTSFIEPVKCDQPNLNGVKNLKQHSRKRICEKPSKCEFCQRIFSDRNKLAIHIRIHTGEKPYKCDVCQRSFSQTSHLKKHIRIHTGEKPYTCDVCQRSFSVKGSLIEHIRVHTGEKPFKCNICQRCFSLKINLTNHIRIHTGEKPYKCVVCLRGFSQKSPLTNHMLIHTGEKPYKCHVCQRSFNGKPSLAKHIRIHTGEKPYKCDVCQHSFTQKINLRNHILVHTGEKPYKCDICQRSFSQKIHLTKHIRIHTGEKPYKCDKCQRGFCQKSSLTNHMLIHTGETL